MKFPYCDWCYHFHKDPLLCEECERKMLTTITPYWGRSDVLQSWLRALARASVPEVYHLVMVIGEGIPPFEHPRVRFVGCQSSKGKRQSIGYYHNVGAELANTTWIMKLDVDAFPNEDYFRLLLPILQRASPRQWFNGGMFYLNPEGSKKLLTGDSHPLSRDAYIQARSYCKLYRPAATNFICRKEDYLRLGGADDRFIGYGWEDYQQIYMLERFERGSDPLPGPIELKNITGRCRDEISRPKARQLFERNTMLGLLHCWHPTSTDPNYRSIDISNHNRQVLLSYIQKARNHDT